MVIIGSLILFLLVGAFFLFKDSLNLVQSVGRVYWITRDYVPKGTPIIAKGFMRELGEPWRVGSGLQIRFAKNRTFQVGICAPTAPTDEENGILNAVGGRYMDATAEEIGEW
jgi:hypothetical protein